MLRTLRDGLRRRSRDERGSALVAALMISLVLSLLGIALFDLTALDARLALGSEADYRALELAQSGIEAGLHQLFLDLCNNVACESPPANGSWADGFIATRPIPASNTTSFQDLIASATVPQPAYGGSFGPAGASVNYASSYYVRAKVMTRDQASALGVACEGVFLGTDPCPYVIQLRATANFRAGNVQSVTRTVEIIARASFNGLGDGIIAGSPASTAIGGNADIHGSLHIVPCVTNPCTMLDFSGNAGIKNNYNGLSTTYQRFIPLLPTIVCAVGTQCAGLTVETLSASVRVAKPDATTLNLQSNATTIGEPGLGSINAATGVRGKPSVEAVFLGDGCQSAGCIDQVTGHSDNIFSDRPVRGYDVNPAPPFPLLPDNVRVLAQPYDDFAACSGPGLCNSNGTVVSGSNNDFFISHAARIGGAPGPPCPPIGANNCYSTDDVAYIFTNVCTVVNCAQATQNLVNLLGTGVSMNWSGNWTFTFRCAGAGAVACDDAAGNRVNGLSYAGASKPDGYQLEWNAGLRTMSVYKCPTGQPVGHECGLPAPASGPAGLVGNDTWRYRITYVDGAGVEFAISPVANVTTRNSRSVRFDTAPVGPTGTLTRRLYRYNPDDNTYHRVGTFGDNLFTTAIPVVDTFQNGACPLVCIGSQAALPPTLNEGLLQLTDAEIAADPFRTTLPIMIYIDGNLKICADCNDRFFYRGNAAFVAKGNASDTLANSTKANFSVIIDPDFLACTQDLLSPGNCSGATDHDAFPKKNLFTFYSAGNMMIGDQSQRDFFGQFYAMGKWTTRFQANVLGAVTARQFDLTGQVPKFWQVRMPRTPTAFPGRGQRWSIDTPRWKECVGTIPPGPC